MYQHAISISLEQTFTVITSQLHRFQIGTIYFKLFFHGLWAESRTSSFNTGIKNNFVL